MTKGAKGRWWIKQDTKKRDVPAGYFLEQNEITREWRWSIRGQRLPGFRSDTREEAVRDAWGYWRHHRAKTRWREVE